MAHPKIYKTSEWNAKPSNGTFYKGKAEGIVIHNTENANRNPEVGIAEKTKSFAIARAIQKHHMQGNGWADTG